MVYRALSVLAFVGATLAAPTEESQCPRTVCADAINPCGVRYGGCYDACDPDPAIRPTPPPCVTLSSTSTDDCSTRTVCADYVNDCGVWYGGCFPDCTPWPTFTAPPCSSSSTPSVVTTTITPPVSTSTVRPTTDCHDLTVCADYINECGQTYGGCFSACTPWPTFTPPPCTTTTDTTTTPTTITPVSPTVTTICEDFFKTCTEGTTTAILTYGG
jgi:hypothetical protein